MRDEREGGAEVLFCTRGTRPGQRPTQERLFTKARHQVSCNQDKPRLGGRGQRDRELGASRVQCWVNGEWTRQDKQQRKRNRLVLQCIRRVKTDRRLFLAKEMDQQDGAHYSSTL